MSFCDRSLRDFFPPPGMINSISSNFWGLVLLFLSVLLFFQESGKAAFTLRISRKKLALCTNFSYIPYSSNSLSFMISLVWVIPTLAQCFKNKGEPLNLKALFPHRISSFFVNKLWFSAHFLKKCYTIFIKGGNIFLFNQTGSIQCHQWKKVYKNHYPGIWYIWVAVLPIFVLPFLELV